MKTTPFRSVSACVLLLSAAVSASAALDPTGYVTLDASDEGSDNSFATAGHWSSGAAPAPGSDYLVQGAKKLRVRTQDVFGGDSVTLDDGATLFLNIGARPPAWLPWAEFSDLRFYDAAISQANNGYSVLRGKVHVLGGTLSIGSNVTRGIDIESDIDGAAGCAIVASATAGTDASDPFFHLGLLGDNSGYHGRFVMNGTNGRSVELRIGGATALGTGDPAPGTPVLSLENGSVLYGVSATVSGSGYTIQAAADTTIGSDSDPDAVGHGLRLAGGVQVVGTSGTTLTIANKDGTTSLGDAEFSGFTKVVVAGGVTLTGGTVFLAPLEIAEGGALTFAMPDAAAYATSGEAFSVPVLTAPNLGAEGLAPDDFYAPIPNAHFEIAEEGGAKTLYLVRTDARPVALLTAADGADAQTSLNSAGNWDVGGAPNDGYNYVVHNPSWRIRCRADATFGGHSLAILGGCLFTINGFSATVDGLELLEGSTVEAGNSWGNRLAGSASVRTSKTGSATLQTVQGRPFELAADFSGTGNLDIHCGAKGDAVGEAVVTVSGDNSAFLGQLATTGEPFCIRFADEDSWGGAGDSFRADKVRIGTTTSIDVASSYNLQQTNRGIAVDAGAALDFRVANGAAMTNALAISGAGSVSKTGAGTLVLAGGSAYTGGTTLSEGTLVAASPMALGGGTLSYADGTVLELAAEGLVLDGAAPFTPLAGSEAPLTVAGVLGLAQASASGRVRLFTLRGASAFDPSAVAFSGVSESFTLWTEADGDNLAVYGSVPKGIVVLVR